MRQFMVASLRPPCVACSPAGIRACWSPSASMADMSDASVAAGSPPRSSKWAALPSWPWHAPHELLSHPYRDSTVCTCDRSRSGRGHYVRVAGWSWVSPCASPTQLYPASRATASGRLPDHPNRIAGDERVGRENRQSAARILQCRPPPRDKSLPRGSSSPMPRRPIRFPGTRSGCATRSRRSRGYSSASPTSSWRTCRAASRAGTRRRI